MRVAIVGLGIAGLMAAWSLLSRGFKVYAIDDASRLSATLISAGIVTPIMPEPFTRLALKSLEIYINSFTESAIKANLYWIYKSDECSAEIARSLEMLGVDIEVLGMGSGIFRLSEGLNLKLHDKEFLAKLNTVIVDTGSLKARVLSKVEEYIVGKAKVDCGRVNVNGDIVEADYIIASMGPWSPLPNNNARIYACETVFLKPAVNIEKSLALIDDSLDFYAAFRGGEAQIGNGGYRTSTRPEDLYSPDLESVSLVLEAFSLRVPDASGWEVNRILSAPCISCVDTAPAVGPLPGCPSTIVVTGLNGAGVSLAPALAEILADYIVGGREIPPYLRLDREAKDLGVKPPEPFRLCPSTESIH